MKYIQETSSERIILQNYPTIKKIFLKANTISPFRTRGLILTSNRSFILDNLFETLLLQKRIVF